MKVFDANASLTADQKRALEVHRNWLKTKKKNKHSNPKTGSEVAEALLNYGDSPTPRNLCRLKNSIRYVTGGFQMTDDPIADAEWFLSDKWNTGAAREGNSNRTLDVEEGGRGGISACVKLSSSVTAVHIILHYNGAGDAVATIEGGPIIAAVSLRRSEDLTGARMWLRGEIEIWLRNNKGSQPDGATYRITDCLGGEEPFSSSPSVQPSGRRAGDGEEKAVVHPSHYNQVPGIECMDVVKHFDFCTGNAIKYLWRAGAKDPSKTIEDLQKAVYYINTLIKDLEFRKSREKEHD